MYRIQTFKNNFCDTKFHTEYSYATSIFTWIFGMTFWYNKLYFSKFELIYLYHIYYQLYISHYFLWYIFHYTFTWSIMRFIDLKCLKYVWHDIFVRIRYFLRIQLYQLIVYDNIIILINFESVISNIIQKNNSAKFVF